MKVRDEWTKTKETIYGHACVKHKVTHETCISGKYGEIWVSGYDRLKVGLFGGVLTRGISKLGLGLKSGEEQIVEFPSAELEKYLLAIEVPAWQSTQVKYANRR